LKSLKDRGSIDPGKSIPVINDKKALIGWLESIDSRLCLDQEIISSLTLWRKKFSNCFFSQFEPTNERTKLWLENLIIKDDARILFLIRDESNKAIGNIGIRSLSGDSAEFDNLVRGESAGASRFMFFSMISFINWIYKVLKVNQIYLHVFSNNLKAIHLYESVGFLRSDIFKCVKKQEGAEIHYTISPRSKILPGELSIVRMSLDKQGFLKSHFWLEA